VPRSTENAKQKKRGRPATGTDPMIGFRSSSELTERIDAFAHKENLSRSKAIRRLVEKGLAAK
jgi:predicted DNA-binding protein